MENLFEVKNLTKRFKNGAGVSDVSFTAKPGEMIGFVGENGAGKTTTIRLIFGLLKRQSGEVLLNNQDILKKDLLQKVAFYPDQNNYPNKYKIFDYIVYNAQLSGMDYKTAVKKTHSLLKALSLDNHTKSSFNQLSAGMQKRALLASVLIDDPEIIILDEPTANLDVVSRVEFLQTLVNLTKKGVTVLITSHIIAELQEIIDHLIIMKDGNVVYDQTFNTKDEKIQDIYLKFNQGGKINANDLGNIIDEGVKNNG